VSTLTVFVLSGRVRDQIGLLVCGTFKNRDLLIKRCRDTALDHRGYVIPVNDVDLRTMVFEADRNSRPSTRAYLSSPCAGSGEAATRGLLSVITAGLRPAARVVWPDCDG